jgi:hypothetical protein
MKIFSRKNMTTMMPLNNQASEETQSKTVKRVSNRKRPHSEISNTPPAPSNESNSTDSSQEEDQQLTEQERREHELINMMLERNAPVSNSKRLKYSPTLSPHNRHDDTADSDEL